MANPYRIAPVPPTNPEPSRLFVWWCGFTTGHNIQRYRSGATEWECLECSRCGARGVSFRDLVVWDSVLLLHLEQLDRLQLRQTYGMPMSRFESELSH